MEVANEYAVSITQHACLLMVTIMTPWAPVVIRLAVAVLQGAGVVLTLGLKTLREQLDIDVTQGLENKELGHKKTTELETTAGGMAVSLRL